jgi:hypothetical protein
MAAHFSKEKGERKKIDDRDGEETGLDLLLDLVLEESRVVFETAVKDKVIRDGSGNNVDEGGAEASDHENRSALAVDVVAR